MSHLPFSGVITALVTPFLNNHEIDFPAFHKLLESQKQARINGVVILGTTGENPTLTDAESTELVLAALEHQTESFHIYVGTGTNDTRTTIEKSKKFSTLRSASQKTPNGIMVVTPYYNKPTQQHMIAHYGEVCRAAPNTPVCVYNVPGRTGVTLQPSTFAKIVSENNNVVAIKEAAGNTNVICELSLLLSSIGKSKIHILSGDDPTFVPSLLCGAHGVISVTTNFIPTPMVAMLTAFQNNHISDLQRLHLETYCLNNGVFCVPNPVGIKWMLARAGQCEPTLRPPLYPAQGHEVETLEKIWHDLVKNKVING